MDRGVHFVILSRYLKPMLALLVAAVVLTGSLSAQTVDDAGDLPFIPPSAKELGLEIPDGPVIPGRNRKVQVKNSGGKQVVAKVHVQAGDRYIVKMPTGQLRSFASGDVKPTKREFAPLTQEELLEYLKQKRFPGFESRQTRRYIYLFNTSKVFSNGTSAILESMYPALVAYLKRSKLDVHDPETPLAVVMFKTEEEFQKFRPMPRGVVAYYDGITNYVVMYEQSALGAIAPELAVKQAISTVAHEGVHQILHNVGVQKRLSRWPMWISEGLPEYFAATEVKRGKWKGVGQPNDMRMYELNAYFQIKGGPDAGGDTIQQTVNAPRLTSTGYASAWALTHYLAKNKEQEFFGYLREMSQIEPLNDEGRLAALQGKRLDNLSLFTKYFGEELGKMEGLMVRHLQKLPYVDPILNQTHYVVKFYSDKGAKVRITTSPQRIYQWKKEMVDALPAPLRARSRFIVRAYPNRSTALRAAVQ